MRELCKLQVNSVNSVNETENSWIISSELLWILCESHRFNGLIKDEDAENEEYCETNREMLNGQWKKKKHVNTQNYTRESEQEIH